MKIVKAKSRIFFVSLIVIKARVNRSAVGSATPPPACLPGWLPLQEPQYFTAIFNAIDSAVNPTPHPWKWFRILIPLTPLPSSSQSSCVQQTRFYAWSSSFSLPHPHSLSLSSLLGLLSLQRICGDGFSSCGLRECAVHNSSHGAGRQAGSSPSLSGLFTRFPSIRLIYVLTLLGL